VGAAGRNNSMRGRTSVQVGEVVVGLT
jgi:hypothetical protein